MRNGRSGRGTIGGRKLLVVGAGDIGQRVIAAISARNPVTALTSTPANTHRLKRLGARVVRGDLDKPGTLSRLPGNWQLLLHCAPPPPRGMRDGRTRNLLRVLATSAPCKSESLSRTIVYLSTSGVYGDHKGALVGETATLAPASARARRRVDAERRLTVAAHRRGWRLTILRVPGIYSESRLPLERLKLGLPAIVASEDSYTNHIHAADLAAIAIKALDRAWTRPRVRVYNANDDSDILMGDYFDLVAHAFGLPAPPRIARAQIGSAVSPMQYSFMRESRRMDNGRLKRELRVRLQFPTVAEGILSVTIQP